VDSQEFCVITNVEVCGHSKSKVYNKIPT